VEANNHVVPHGDRSGVVIEPYLTDQWYVDAKTLAQPAIAAVRDGRTVFVPKQWEATYYNWMENIQPGASRASCSGATRFPPGTAGRSTATRSRSPRRRLSSPKARPRRWHRPASTISARW